MAPILWASSFRFDPIYFLPEPVSHPPDASRVSSNLQRRSSFGVCFSHRHLQPFLSSAPGSGCRHVRRRNLGFGPMDFDVSRLRAVTDGDYGGNGGGGFSGGSGGGGSSGGGGDGDEGGSSDGLNLFSWYLRALDKYPVFTKSITSALLTLVGDLICQLSIDRVLKLDLKRTFVFTFLGFALVGPTLHFWYFYLSKLVTLQGASGAFLRLLLDQFLFSPIFIGVFLCSLVTLEGRPSQVVPKLQQEWFASVLANWQLWIPFQFLNFRFVPQQFQVLMANVVALVWNVILSFKAHKEVVMK